METLLITLDRLSLKEPLKQSGETLALTTLVLPRPGIRRKTSLRPFRLQAGKASLARKPFHERALLKEKVDGRFGLTVQLTRPVKHAELQTLLRGIAGLGLEAAGDLLAGGLRMSALRPLLREPFDALADELTDDAPDFILQGGVDLNSDSLSQSKGPDALTVTLQLTQRIRKSDLPPGPKSREKRRTSSKTYKKGLAVGEAVLKLGFGR